ncbi:MAG TPA: hypothetical protein VGW39_16130 [Chthoniobacterales bacterium]|nr:hypothetical protein [Chthoniobacterales bacterium]
MNRVFKFFIITAATALTIASAHAEPDQPTQTLFKNLMAATVSNNYDGFVAECDAVMKAALTKPMLEGVSKQIEPRARQGYNAQYLGELNQRGYKVHLWRLSFKDAGDDVLATLSVKDGKAGGFYLH